MITRPFRTALTVLLGSLALAACGQSGDLYLPGEAPASQQPPVQTRPSPTAAPEPTPRPEALP